MEAALPSPTDLMTLTMWEVVPSMQSAAQSLDTAIQLRVGKRDISETVMERAMDNHFLVTLSS